MQLLCSKDTSWACLSLLQSYILQPAELGQCDNIVSLTVSPLLDFPQPYTNNYFFRLFWWFSSQKMFIHFVDSTWISHFFTNLYSLFPKSPNTLKHHWEASTFFSTPRLHDNFGWWLSWLILGKSDFICFPLCKNSNKDFLQQAMDHTYISLFTYVQQFQLEL